MGPHCIYSPTLSRFKLNSNITEKLIFKLFVVLYFLNYTNFMHIKQSKTQPQCLTEMTIQRLLQTARRKMFNLGELLGESEKQLLHLTQQSVSAD